MAVQDSLWLYLDQPTNPLVITSVLWTADPVDPARLRRLVRQRLLGRYPVFRQRPVLGGPLGCGARWADDPDFDLDRHLVVRPMPAPGTRAALQEYVGAQRGRPLDRAHPLWSIDLLQGYGHGSAVVQRYHHAMADGIRLTQVMLSMLDPVTPGALAPVAHHNGQGHLLEAALHAVEAGTAALNSAGSLVKLLAWSNPPNGLSGQPGVAKTALWAHPVALSRLSQLGHATGTTVNDVCLALVAGAVGRFLAERGSAAVEDLAWMVPVNLEPFDTELPTSLGNHFALVMAVLPHQMGDFGARLAEVHHRMARIRHSYEPQLTFGTQYGIAVSPTSIGTRISRFFTGKTIGVLTNVPGPRRPMELAGAQVDGVVGWAPCSGQQTVTVCIFSYAGQVTVGFGTDRTVLPDAERLVAAFDAEVAAAIPAEERSPS